MKIWCSGCSWPVPEENLEDNGERATVTKDFKCNVCGREYVRGDYEEGFFLHQQHLRPPPRRPLIKSPPKMKAKRKK